MIVENGFSIQFVSKVTGINPHTIRAWEKRYGVVVPQRASNSRRIYTQENIDRLKKINELVKIGSNISDVARLSEDELESMYNSFAVSNTISIKDINCIHNPIDIDGTKDFLILALRNYKMDILSHELEKLKRCIEPRDFSLKLLTPLLGELKELVDRKVFSESQLGSISNILKFHSEHILYKNMGYSDSQEVKVIFACNGDDLSDLRLMAADLLCGHYKVKFYFIRDIQKRDSLIEFMNTLKASYLFLGNGAYSSDFEKQIEEIMQSLENQSELWVDKKSFDSQYLCQGNLHFFDKVDELDRIFLSLSSYATLCRYCYRHEYGLGLCYDWGHMDCSACSLSYVCIY